MTTYVAHLCDGPGAAIRERLLGLNFLFDDGLILWPSFWHVLFLFFLD